VCTPDSILPLDLELVHRIQLDLQSNCHNVSLLLALFSFSCRSRKSHSCRFPNNIPRRRHSRLASRPRCLVRINSLHRSLQHNWSYEYRNLLFHSHHHIIFISGMDIFHICFCGMECRCVGRSLFRCFWSEIAFACGDWVYSFGDDVFELLLW
jgi:hypothetical protein